MKYTLSIFLLLLFLNILSGQNLIKDPGFESVYLYKDGKREHFGYKDWKFLSRIPMNTWAGAPDFEVYNSRSLSDEKIKSYFTPFAGNSYLSSVYTIDKNLYQGQLVKPLIKGKKYKFSCQYKFGGEIMSESVIQNLLNYNMGVMFSNSDLSDTLSVKKIHDPKVELPIHISFNNFKYKSDNSKWKYFETTFISDSDYNYIVIGSFQKLMDKSPFPPYIHYGISFRFDEVSLVEE